MKERELNLIDMLVSIVARWRGIIVFAVIGALLIGAADYVKSANQVNATQIANQEATSVEEQLLQIEEKMTAVEKASVLSVIDDEKEYALRKEFLDTSAVMKMDPYNVHRIELIYKVQAEDVTNSYMVGTVYEDLVNGVGLTKRLR